MVKSWVCDCPPGQACIFFFIFAEQLHCFLADWQFLTVFLICKRHLLVLSIQGLFAPTKFCWCICSGYNPSINDLHQWKMRLLQMWLTLLLKPTLHWFSIYTAGGFALVWLHWYSKSSRKKNLCSNHQKILRCCICGHGYMCTSLNGSQHFSHTPTTMGWVVTYVTALPSVRLRSTS